MLQGSLVLDLSTNKEGKKTANFRNSPPPLPLLHEFYTYFFCLERRGCGRVFVNGKRSQRKAPVHFRLIQTRKWNSQQVVKQTTTRNLQDQNGAPPALNHKLYLLLFISCIIAFTRDWIETLLLCFVDVSVKMIMKLWRYGKKVGL